MALDKEICKRCYRSRLRVTSLPMTGMAMDKFEAEWRAGTVWCQVADDRRQLFTTVADRPPSGCVFAAEQAVSQWG